MSVILKTCNGIIVFFCSCFKSTSSKQEQNILCESLLLTQMTPINSQYEINKEQQQQDVKQEQDQNKNIDVENNNHNINNSNISRSGITSTIMVNNLLQKPVGMKKQPLSQRNSSQSFHTIKSRSSKPMSRLTFKLCRKKASKISSNEQQFTSIRMDLDQNRSIPQGNIEVKQFNLSLQEWIKKQFQLQENNNRYPHYYNIDVVTQSRIENGNMFELLVHKLQDYLTFYSDNNDKSVYCYNYNPKFMSSIVNSNADFNYSNNMPKYMSLCRIYGNTTDPKTFLKWFNTSVIQSKLYNFNKIQLVHLQNQHKILQYPILRTQQFGYKLNLKKIYYLIKQIQFVKFQGQEKFTLLQIDWNSKTQQGVLFERIVRIQIQEEGMIEIYTESSEDIKLSNVNDYFKERWDQFYQRLQSDKILPPNKNY